MILLDAYALVAFLADEPAAEEVERLLRKERPAVTTVNLAEAVDVARRVRGLPADQLRGVLEPLLADELRPVTSSEHDAWHAAELRSRYYDRTSRAVSIADCLLLAAAGPEDEIATSDPAVAHVARAEGIGLVALPDSSGCRPY